MKTKFSLLFLLAVAYSLSSLGQKAPAKFGDVSMDQLKMVRYEKDSSASAVVLIDYGATNINYTQGVGFKLNFERLTRIKILSKEGLDWANFEIHLYHDGGNTEKISGTKAVTYNLENGKVVQSKLKSDAIFKEKLDANWDIVKLALPNVKEGSVVEITYQISSDFFFNLHNWEFQSTIPIILSEYRANIPEYFYYEKYMQGYVPLTVNEESTKTGSILLTLKERTGGNNTQTEFENQKIDYTENVYRWAAQDVPAFKSEPFMTTQRDYVSKLNFELSYTHFPNQAIKQYRGTWESLNNSFLTNAYFGQLVKGSGFLNKAVEEATIGKTTPNEKTEAIYKFVRNKMTWDGNKTKYPTDDNLRKPWEANKGNAAEINLILTSMLRKADLNANPVLVSTRDHGFVREQAAISSQFNYTICSVFLDGKTILLDATDHTLPMNMLPERCLNGQGFVISEENSGWVKLISGGKTRTVTGFDLALRNDGKLDGKVSFTKSGYDAQDMRIKYFDKGEAEYLKAMAESQKWELKKSEFENVKKLDEPVKEAYEVSLPAADGGQGTIYLSPIALNRMETNPFKAEKRDYPVDFGKPYERLYLGKIKIPEGFVVDELPKSRVVVLPGNSARYVYNLTLLENTLTVTSQFFINKSLFIQDEYPGLREFYNQVVAKQAEQIVIKKKP